jgi:hypothetical protein
VTQRAIRAAFESRLASFATARGLSVAWENLKFKEPEALYLRAAMLPAPTTSDDLAGSHRSYRGALQVLIVAPINIGAGEALNLADALGDHFPVNLALTSGGVTVTVTQPASIAPALQSETRYTVPVSIFYRADTI